MKESTDLGVITIGNDGADIASTNYWTMEDGAMSGMWIDCPA